MDDADYLQKAINDIKAEAKDSSGKELAVGTYKKENGEYTKAALEQFLYEKAFGKSHKYVPAEENKHEKPTDNETPWYAKFGYAAF